MDLVIRLNGDDITSQVQWKGFDFTEEIDYKVDVVKFAFLITPSKTTQPQVEDEIEILVDSVTVFTGLVDTVTYETTNHKTVVLQVQAADSTTILERVIVNRVFEGMTPSEIVQDIIENELVVYGFTVGTIDSIGTDLGDVIFQDRKINDIFTDLAEYTTSFWRVNPDKTIDFTQRGALLAPITIQDDNGTYIADSLKIEKTTKQIRNTIKVIGSDQVSDVDITDKVGTGDAETKTFLLPYVYDTEPTVTVNAVSKTVGEAYVDDPGSFDCLWDRNGKRITFATAPAATHDVEVTGKPLIPLVFQRTAGEGAKKYYFKIVDKTLKTVEAAQQRAQAEINNYAKAVTSGEFQTRESGLKVGQRIYVKSDRFGINDYFVISRIQTRIRANSLTKTVQIASKKEYDIIDLFRHLLRKGEKEFGFFRGANEVLQNYIDFNDKVLTQESWAIKTSDVLIEDTAQVATRVFFQVDTPLVYVVGPYARVDDDDPKTVPILDRGCELG